MVFFSRILILLLLTCSQAIAHSGRTDKNGGHNCSQKSKEKGLCTGYHYHNGGGLHFDDTDELVTADNLHLLLPRSSGLQENITEQDAESGASNSINTEIDTDFLNYTVIKVQLDQ